jgi:ATP-dependent RNA helicase RhlE
MLDMGFIVPVKRIVAKLPKERQTLLFSATMPQDVAGLAASLLKEPVRVEVTPVATTAERISQRVHFVEKANKRALLAHLLGDQGIARALVFARTKHGANKVAEQLDRAGVRTDAIHGNKSQNARQKALNDFRNGKVRVLVATDIAARGIDVDGITHVINFDLPNEPESYVHRIGRTARAGNDGIAISFCDADERAFLRDIEKTIRQQVTVDADHPFHAAHIADGVRQGGSAPAGQRGRGGRPGKPQRHGTDGATTDRGGRPERAGRGHDQNRGRQANSEQPHGRDRRRPDAGFDGNRRDASGHHAHGGEQRHHAQGRDGRGPNTGPDGGARHRGSNGHRQHAQGGEGHHQQGHRHGQRQESGQSAHGGPKAPGQRPHGQQRARQDSGGQQPLKRTHRGERGGAQSGGRSQRFEPVRMR